MRVHSLQKKRLRMRLAQSSYRARKKEAQESERVRADELSSALDNALATFSTLHRRILDTPQISSSPEILFHLNDAVTKMVAIAADTNKVLSFPHALEDISPSSHQQAPGTRSQPPTTAVDGELHNEWSSEPVLNGVLTPGPSITVDSGTRTIFLQTKTSNQIPVSARVIRACIKRVVPILSDSTVYGSQPPALALPLQLLGKEALMVFSLQRLSIFHPSVTDFRYPFRFTSQQPHMYRVVEGETKTIPRATAPLVQQIVRGKTRTRLDTNFGPLQGEWLEAVDVEEYLEERGIYLRNTASNDTTPTDDTMHQPFVPDIERNINMLALLGDETRGEMTRDIMDNTRSRLGSMEQRHFITLSADFHGHEPADYSVFGLPGPGRSLPSSNSQIHPTAMADIPATDALSIPQSDSNHQTAQVIAQASRVTVDLDKLVHLLAENAMCIGPAPGIRKSAVDASIRGSVILT